MPNQMDERYFDEKKGLARDAISDAIREATEALNLVQATRYGLLDVISADQVHEMLKVAEARVRSARRDFEKSRWASARTEIEFNEWLKNGPGRDLV